MHFQQIPNSMRGGGGLDRQKKKKIPNLQLFPNLEGGIPYLKWSKPKNYGNDSHTAGIQNILHEY